MKEQETLIFSNPEYDTFVIDFDKVSTLEDVILILKSMNLQYRHVKGCNEDKFKEIRHLLKEV